MQTLLISSTKKSSGKTIVTIGLVGLATKLGYSVQTFKKAFKDHVYSFQKLNKLPELDLDIALTVKFDPSNEIRVEGSSS